MRGFTFGVTHYKYVQDYHEKTYSNYPDSRYPYR